MSSETYDVGSGQASCSPPAISNREAFLQSKAGLLANCFGKVVGFANGKLVGVADCFDSLAHRLADRRDCLEVYVEIVEEAAFQAPATEIIPTHFETYPT